MNRWVTLAAAGLVIVVVSMLLLWGPPAGGVERLRETLLEYGPWAVLISASLMIGQAVIAPLPGNVITITNGLLFGPFWGALLSWSSTLVGASLCFVLSRGFGRPFALRVAGRSLLGAEKFFDRYGLPAVFAVRIMPFVPFDAVSYAAGLVGVPYSRFLLATSIGIIPSVVVYSWVGSAVISAYWWVLIAALTVSVIMLWALPRILKKARIPFPFLVGETERTAAD